MPLIINTNLSALTAQRNLANSQAGMARAIQRLSTGLRINGAVDDAAGLAISDRLTAQIRGLNQSVRNANDGVSALQTADGSLNEYANLLQRARELAVQSANDSNSASDRASLNSEVINILSELDRLASTVQFNNKKLLDGTFQNAQFQLGANAGETVSFGIGSFNTVDLGANILQGNAVSSTGLSGLTGASTLTINGTVVTIGAQTAIEGVVAAINNRSGDTKTTAIKNTSTVLVDTAFAGVTGGTQTLTINGINITLTTVNADTSSQFVATVNGFSGQTGVVASTSGNNMVFTRSSGGTISIMESTASSAVAGAVGDVIANSSARTFNAGFTLSVDLDKTLAVVSSGVGTDMGFTTAIVNSAVTAKRINAINISSPSASTDTLSVIDYGLAQLNRTRGDIGAVQNRFVSAITSLTVSSENLSAARSRVRDADVAAETAELTRNQILIQAGVAVLAQANQLPSVALSLLGK